MNILYDLSIFSWQKHGGVSRYFLELANGLTKHSVQVSFPPGIVTNREFAHKYHYPTCFPDLYLPGKIPVLKLFDKLLARLTLAKGKYDLFHPTSYDLYFLPSLGGKPYVLTVFDLIHEHFPESFNKGNSTPANRAKLLSQASAVIAISQSTKDDLVKHYHLDPKRIHVTHLGNSLAGLTGAKINLPKKYLLYVGSRAGYKNFARFVSASLPILSKNPDLYIVCIGGGEFSKRERQMFGQHVTHFLWRDLTDRQLVSAYQQALTLVYPSLYEGFGLPLVEAMSCGCPIATSSVSSMPEVCGQAAAYFDPQDASSISQTISKLLDDTQTRLSLARAGRTQAKKYSWDKCASLTLDIYQKILKA